MFGGFFNDILRAKDEFRLEHLRAIASKIH